MPQKKATAAKSKEGGRVPTGIREYDALVEGGFKKESVNLIAGGTGTGKTLFAIQFLANGITKYDDPGLYITFEEKREKLNDDLLPFGIELAELEKKGKFFFMEYQPEQVKKLLVEGGGTIESLIIKHKIKRLVIDSISAFALLYQDPLSRKEAALQLFHLIAKWGCTAVLTAQGPNIDVTKAMSAELEFEADSITLMYHLRKSPEGVFQILRD